MHDVTCSANERSAPLVRQSSSARLWLAELRRLGRSEHTVAAYGCALERFFQFCAAQGICPEAASRQHLRAYVQSFDAQAKRIDQVDRADAATGVGTNLTIAVGTSPSISSISSIASPTDATLRLWLTALRLYFQYLRSLAIRNDNPLDRGTGTLRTWLSVGRPELTRCYRHLPWVPTVEQWNAFIEMAREEPTRNRLIVALAYETALSPRQLCALRTSDFWRARRLIRLHLSAARRGHRWRLLPYSEVTERLYAAYLRSRARGRAHHDRTLLLFESSRHPAQSLSPGTCRVLVARVAKRAGVPGLSLRTLRHMRLMDLARAGWSSEAIAAFAGLEFPSAATPYRRLVERELLMDGYHAVEELTAARLGPLANDLAGDRAVPPLAVVPHCHSSAGE